MSNYTNFFVSMRATHGNIERSIVKNIVYLLFFCFISYFLSICMCTSSLFSYPWTACSLFKVNMMFLLMSHLLLVVLFCQIALVSIVSIFYASEDGFVCLNAIGLGIRNTILQHNGTLVFFPSSFISCCRYSMSVWLNHIKFKRNET